MVTVLTLMAFSAFRWGASATGGGQQPATVATYIPTWRPRRGR